MSDDRPYLRKPGPQDGGAMWALARESGVLEANSTYSYVMLCSYFADTCVVAEQAGELVGFATAFVAPSRPESLFVWQIGVAGSQRGRGLGTTLLMSLLEREACDRIRYIEASVAASNAASRALFGGLARRLAAPCTEAPGFESDWFPGEHECEPLLRIGPIERVAVASATG